MPIFVNTISPTPFGFFDADAQFQSEADDMVTFVKRRLGDDVISVELTSKMIWACFEEACCEYARLIHEFRIRSELVNVLGLPTGSTDLTNTYPRQTLEYLIRMAEPYGSAIGIGGSYDTTLGYFDLEPGRQDYNLYTELKDAVSGTVIYQSLPTGSRGKIRIVEMMHYEPIAAQSYLLNASNVTNYLATEFNYESYVNSTVYYVLPVFEDVLRRQALEHAYRVRRSNFSYEVFGSNVRIYPMPTTLNTWSAQTPRLYVRVYAGMHNPLHPSAYDDDSIYGISGPNNIPFGNIPYITITQPGRAWIRQLTLALCMLTLGQVRSKLASIPIPNSELRLNGPELIQEGNALRDKLYADFKEFLAELTTSKLVEQQANQAENLNRQLRYVPFRHSIVIG